MKFSVDGWDPSYGSAFDVAELSESTATVDATMEVPAGEWAPLPPPADPAVPSAVLFVDGVRRIDARVWIDDENAVAGGSRAVEGICASYAAGVVRTCLETALVEGAEIRRVLFTEAHTATHIATGSTRYMMHHAEPSPSQSGDALSNALQRALSDLEAIVAADARRNSPSNDDLLIVDGPLRDRARLPRTLGYIKSHNAQYLPPELNGVVATLDVGQRTPIFSIATGWQRYSWYLRLPCAQAGPWTGIVRLEAPPSLDMLEVTALANTSQALLGRFASEEYRDSRAPQNLVPIAGLEKALRHQLGSASLLYREIRTASRTAAAELNAAQE